MIPNDFEKLLFHLINDLTLLILFYIFLFLTLFKWMNRMNNCLPSYHCKTYTDICHVFIKSGRTDFCCFIFFFSFHFCYMKSFYTKIMPQMDTEFNLCLMWHVRFTWQLWAQHNNRKKKSKFKSFPFSYVDFWFRSKRKYNNNNKTQNLQWQNIVDVRRAYFSKKNFQ